MKKILILVVCIFLSSCATEERFRQYLSNTMGVPEEELVLNLGVPDRTYNVGTLRVVEYTFSQSSYVPMYQQQTVYHKNAYGQNIGSSSQWVDNGYYTSSTCMISFYLQNNRVINWRYKGNGCKA